LSEGIFSEVDEALKQLCLPKNFYRKLLKDDDWSFIIKLNALVEAVSTHALVARLYAPELLDCFSRLDLGHGKFGKVVMLSKIGAITADQKKVLITLYELRNLVAHDISEVTFSFTEYVKAMDKSQLKSFVSNLGHGLKEKVSFSGKLVKRDEFVKSNPKLSLWLTVSEIIACLNMEAEIATLRLKTLGLQQINAKPGGLLDLK
jgi:hypothetical protein